jgi:hypothetical protein
MTFEKWLQKAYEADHAQNNETHFYLQLNSVGPDE